VRARLDYLDPALNPPELPFLAAAREESEECASVFETTPYLDAAATPARLHEGLASARFVHFSGHGALDVVAPSFQTLFLAPDARGDGRVFAHELLAGSFAGCELVSLSACESGLGRFDLADNLMGIPAALLSGGVRHVIATLWEVREATARLFFRSLYQELHRGAKCSDAFELARRTTRTSFPAFRDWGAFILTGHEGVEI
jgi:CHAT domain-containing protein